MQSWGKHLILDLRGCAPLSIRSQHHIAWFSRTLVKGIDMVPYGDPQIVMFGTGNKKGYTLVQLIETSNITGHFCEETNDAYIDVFSCKDFCPRRVEEITRSYFQPESVIARTVERGAPDLFFLK